MFVSNNKLSAAPRAVANDIIDRFLTDISPDAGKDWVAIVTDVMNTRSGDSHQKLRFAIMLARIAASTVAGSVPDMSVAKSSAIGMEMTPKKSLVKSVRSTELMIIKPMTILRVLGE